MAFLVDDGHSHEQHAASGLSLKVRNLDSCSTAWLVCLINENGVQKTAIFFMLNFSEIITDTSCVVQNTHWHCIHTGICL